MMEERTPGPAPTGTPTPAPPRAPTPQFKVLIRAGKDAFEFGIMALNVESLAHMLDCVLTMSTGRIAGYEIFGDDGAVIRSVFPFRLIGAIAPEINKGANRLIIPGATMTTDLEKLLKGRKRG